MSILGPFGKLFERIRDDVLIRLSQEFLRVSLRLIVIVILHSVYRLDVMRVEPRLKPEEFCRSHPRTRRVAREPPPLEALPPLRSPDGNARAVKTNERRASALN